MVADKMNLNGTYTANELNNPKRAAQLILQYLGEDEAKFSQFLQMILTSAMEDDGTPLVLYADEGKQFPKFCIRYAGEGKPFVPVDATDLSSDLQAFIRETVARE